MKSKSILIAYAMISVIGMTCLSACENKDDVESRGTDTDFNIVVERADALNTDQSGDMEENEPGDLSESSEPEILHFVDVFGEQHETEINPDIEKNSYDKSLFIHDGYSLTYDDPDYESRMGVDVSHHNGQVDWQKVADAGYDFAILRIGYRGYGESGSLNMDTEFDRNIAAAREAGLDVGVYFFAQAINEDEAVEEAEYVLDHLKGYELQLPVVYDPESILDDDARTDNVTGEQFTKNTAAFCRTVEAAGYDAMIYSNMMWEAYELDLTQLADWPIWYADYEAQPQTPYRFTFWQYSNTGSVPGIDGDADLNIWMIKK